ncbi:MAG: PQQ-dependent catabolism-associated CXXCW motif protein [Pseudomonadota bacterium]
MPSDTLKLSTVFGLMALIAVIFVGAGASGTAWAVGASAGVKEPTGYRMDTYRAPVPDTLSGARVAEVDEAERLWRSAEAVFIDVYPQAPKPPGLPKSTIWRAPKHKSIAGATWLANVGYGVLRPEIKEFFKAELVRLTDGDPSKTIVFFCLRDCWMSWNAAKRAVSWGYENVVWFPDGTDGWGDFDLPSAMLAARLVEDAKAKADKVR